MSARARFGSCKIIGRSRRVDEACVRVGAQRTWLYRAVDRLGRTLDYFPEEFQMKKWPSLLTFGLLISGAALAESSAPPEPAAHHELIGSAGNQVEIYWAAPPGIKGKLPVVVYIHGVQGEDRPGARNFVEGGLLKISAAKGYLSVGMSMPGYGQSTGKADFCGAGTQAALRSVLSRVRTWASVDRNRIVVSGLSCGAVAAAMVAGKEPLAGMVLISGVYDFADMYQKWHTPAWPLEPAVMKYIDDSVAADGTPEKASLRRSALANASRFRSPVLLVAQRKDRIVDPEQSIRLDKALKQSGKRSTLILNSEGGHVVSYEEWAGYVNDFARGIFRPTSLTVAAGPVAVSRSGTMARCCRSMCSSGNRPCAG